MYCELMSLTKLARQMCKLASIACGHVRFSLNQASLRASSHVPVFAFAIQLFECLNKNSNFQAVDPVNHP